MLHWECPWQVCMEEQLCLGLVAGGLSQLSGELPKSPEGEWVFFLVCVWGSLGRPFTPGKGLLDVFSD